ncbi:MAG: serine hydrolase [Chloroflexales bacterium]|nr:serine hydrolase [Chloroflexales bacterium]
MTEQRDNLIGRTLGGYRIERKIGIGGMGAVYQATQLRLGRQVALKVLAPALALDQEFAARFIHEGRTIAALEHPNIIPIYEAGEATLDEMLEPLSYLAMRYVSGGSLRDLIARQGSLDPMRTLALLSQAAAGLDAAHRHGIIHRDIKPGNLLIEPGASDKGRERLFIADFGIAKSHYAASFKTQTGTFLGTPEYMAPEQFRGAPVDQQADVYALAVVCYEMLAGYAPFRAETPAMVIYRKLSEPAPRLNAAQLGLPPSLDAVLARGLAAHPHERYSSNQELVAALRVALAEAPTAVSQPLALAVGAAGDGAAWRVEQKDIPVQAKPRPAPSAPPQPVQPGAARRSSLRSLVAFLLGSIVALVALVFVFLNSVQSPGFSPQAPASIAETVGVWPAITELIVTPGAMPTSTPAVALPPFPEQQLETMLNQAGGDFGVMAYNEQHDALVYRRNTDQVFPAASLINLPIALTVYDLAQRGELSLDQQLVMEASDITQGNGVIRNDPIGTSYSLRELCRYMLRNSDNTAGNMILKHIGFAPVNALMGRLGANQTQVQRYFLDLELRQTGRDNLTSPADMLLLLQQLEPGTLLDLGATQELLTALIQNPDRSKLLALFPPNISVAHKTGTLPVTDNQNNGVEHDVGIVILSDQRYIVVLMSHNLPDNEAGRAAIAGSSSLIFEYMQRLALIQ